MVKCVGAHGPIRLDRSITTLDGDKSVLCAMVATAGKVVIVINRNYPDALAHAEHHLASQPHTGVWLCSPDCPGSG